MTNSISIVQYVDKSTNKTIDTSVFRQIKELIIRCDDYSNELPFKL